MTFHFTIPDSLLIKESRKKGPQTERIGKKINNETFMLMDTKPFLLIHTPSKNVFAIGYGKDKKKPINGAVRCGGEKPVTTIIVYRVSLN